MLDALFNTTGGAALQILKVEIGGDAQSTDGSEPSHARDASEGARPVEEDHRRFSRGYEWWLMREAKRRNPEIKLYGLPWAFPSWLSAANATTNAKRSGDRHVYDDPARLARYVVSWVRGAWHWHGLRIDYLGGWNERGWSAAYYKELRRQLDADPRTANVEVIGADGSWGATADALVNAVDGDPELKASLAAIGVHYPGTRSSDKAKACGVPLWASEEDSTFADLTGGGCLARALNRNFVDGAMTSLIVWNAVGAYMSGLPFFSSGLLDAAHPWSGTYTLRSPVWLAAHTTQFTRPGWRYLPVGQGSGKLAMGGTYVTYCEEAGETDLPEDSPLARWAVVIEKMSAKHSACVRPQMEWFDTWAENATFVVAASSEDGGGGQRSRPLTGLQGGESDKVGVWRSCLGFEDSSSSSVSGGGEAAMFERLDDIPVRRAADGSGEFELTLEVEVDCVYTVAPVDGKQHRADFPPSPSPSPFPLPYRSRFFGEETAGTMDVTAINMPQNRSDQPLYFADQAGTFAVSSWGHPGPIGGAALVQVAPQRPVSWSGDLVPFTLIGDAMWQDVDVSANVALDFDIDCGGGFVAARVDSNGPGWGVRPAGIYFVVAAGGYWRLEPSLQNVADGNLSVSLAHGVDARFDPSPTGSFTRGVRVRLQVTGGQASGWVDGVAAFAGVNVSAVATHGFVALGTTDYLKAAFIEVAIDGAMDRGAGAFSAGGAAAPHEGTPLSTQPCGNDLLVAAGALAWDLAGGRFALRATIRRGATPLCAGATDGNDTVVRLVPCTSPGAFSDLHFDVFNGMLSTAWPAEGHGHPRRCIMPLNTHMFDERSLRDEPLRLAQCDKGDRKSWEGTAIWIYDYEMGSLRLDANRMVHCAAAYEPVEAPSETGGLSLTARVTLASAVGVALAAVVAVALVSFRQQTTGPEGRGPSARVWCSTRVRYGSLPKREEAEC